MILYFSGTGNSEYVAKRIAQAIQDECVDLFDNIRNIEYSTLHSDKAWILVSPTYAWRIPRVLQDWLMKSELCGNRNIYVVMTCGDGIGNAQAYMKKLCAHKALHFQGCLPIVMPENYIAMFPTPSKEASIAIIKQAEDKISQVVAYIKQGKAFPFANISIKDKLSSGIVNDVFYPMFVHAKKFRVSDACISCGKCVKLCPLSNIHLAQGKPVWDDNCTHCMACISYCPSEAIEYGEKSKGKPRYTCPKGV